MGKQCIASGLGFTLKGSFIANNFCSRCGTHQRAADTATTQSPAKIINYSVRARGDKVKIKCIYAFD
jgi:hypothetical protein